VYLKEYQRKSDFMYNKPLQLLQWSFIKRLKYIFFFQVLRLGDEPQDIVDKLTSDVEHKVPTGTDEQEPEEVVDQLTSDVEHKVPTDTDDQEAKPEVNQLLWFSVYMLEKVGCRALCFRALY
jgi:hypothetical protein